MEQVVDNDSQMRLQALGSTDPSAEYTCLVVEFPELICREHRQVTVGHLRSQSVRQVRTPEYKRPSTPPLVIEEGYSIGRSNEAKITMVTVHVRVVSDFGMEATRSLNVPVGNCITVVEKMGYQFRS